MIKAHTFKGKTVAIFGLGRSGVTSALSLMAGGARVLAWDDSDMSVQAARAAGVRICDLRDADWTKIDELVLSPGVPHDLPSPHWVAKLAKSHNVPIICDIEIFAREVAACSPQQRPQVIAITGTNGKSTTTSLIGHILNSFGKDAQVGGNIGRGVLDLDPIHRGAYYVLELSSYQLERTYSLRADAAIFLNLTPDHLDRHGDMDGYEQAKRRIFQNQTQAQTAIIGVDNPAGVRICSEMTARYGPRILPISGRKSLGRGVSVIQGKLYASPDKNVECVADLKLAQNLDGTHNWQNAAAAFAAAQALGLSAQIIGKSILDFPGLVHRMENVGRMAHLRFVNDSKATNADASEQALNTYENIFWIAGGQAKANGIKPLKKYFPRVRKAYLIGDAAEDFHAVLQKNGVDAKISKTLKLAVMCAVRDALNSKLKDPVILLSPACASFDQFRSFEARGDAFRTQVLDIIGLYEREMSAYYSRGDVA